MNLVASATGKHKKSQITLDKIVECTSENKMELNKKKTGVSIFNSPHKYQFSTWLYLEDSLIETVT
jgi:hypothetical protein